jgi:hypothetical protein
MEALAIYHLIQALTSGIKVFGGFLTDCASAAFALGFLPKNKPFAATMLRCHAAEGADLGL